MNSIEQQARGANPGMPLDLKLYYGFVVVLLAGVIGALVFILPRTSRHANPAEPDHPRQLIDFALTNQAGRLVTRADLDGRFLVVSFIHTGCSVSCLEVNSRMAEVQNLTGGTDDVLLLSLTVDPGTDTPPVLAEFGEQFGANTERWVMLTGKKAPIYELIETSFLRRDPEMRTVMPGGFFDVDRIAVVDRAGNVRRYFNGMVSSTPVAIVKFLAELRAESGSS